MRHPAGSNASRKCLPTARTTTLRVRLYFDRVRFPDGREGHYNRIMWKGPRRRAWSSCPPTDR